ncbi:50S ribosomal protein L32 [Patescibacteria group bacterium]|nr:50S ribosomal protein L32 [Patescibacteria group bacterium]
MSVRMRHTKGHTANRRSHHGLTAPRLSNCQECGAIHQRHRMCETCGKYNGKQIVDVMAKVEKKTERMKTKARALGKEVEKTEKKVEKKEKKVVSKK